MPPSFHFPDLNAPSFGRALSAAWVGGELWAVTRFEHQKREGVVLLRNGGSGPSRKVLWLDAHVHQPVVASDGERALIAWNECAADGWRIRVARVSDDGSQLETLHTFSSERWCGPPSLAVSGGETWVAWASIVEERIAVLAAKAEGETLVPGPAVSDERWDAFRPSVAIGEEGPVLSWDEYVGSAAEAQAGSLRHNGGAYRVVAAVRDGDGWRRATELGQEGERWLGSRLAPAPGGGAYLTWTVLREVSDDKGIAEHQPFAMLALVKGGRADILRDPGNPLGDRAAADLREGLLGSKAYMGYHGLRRNPQVAVSASGEALLLWEVRKEAERDFRSGYLMARRINSDGTLGDNMELLAGGHSHAVPPRFEGASLPVAFLQARAEGMDILQAASAAPASAKPYPVNHADWARWRDEPVPAQAKPQRAVEIAGRKFRIFWADTHCHSVFCPDAEGEVDEIILFARDIADLDAVSVIDNDYYPHKTLSEAEWRTHQEMSRHFTREGAFVVFPGWEFTFHRKDLDPDFNHRTVLYPRAEGKLFRRNDPESCTDRKLLVALKGSGAVVYPHHCTYEILDSGIERNVEVVSSWRVCFEETDHSRKRLAAGDRFGFIGSSDTHRAVPGLGGALTGVFAEELTPEALFEAYHSRRLVATQGFFLFADFRVCETFMGGEGKCSGAPVVRAEFEAPSPIEFVEVIRDGEAVHRAEPGGEKCAFEFADEKAPPGTRYYYARLKLEGDPSFNAPPGTFDRAHTSDSPYPHNFARARGVFAWTSPVWMEVG